ncbi:DUF1353 domain-containing protein [Geminisphaera colitermitum]|uniref:DUF1353 domain-containing protein n=1 Tax=Geminisphaera colitermitum TaxID=1148786 RepID=UPI000158D35E|nr:DUF1353 domain-containing protein [Geminisphaera colitermitum]
MTAALVKFPRSLKTKTILGQDRALLLAAPFAFISDTHGRIDLPTGFFTDLASIPRLFWRVFPPAGKYTAAAIIHDFLYANQSTEENKSDNILLTRAEADAIFLEAMEALGVNWLTRSTIYRAVRMGGGGAWRDNYSKRTGLPYPSKPSARLPDFYRQRHIKR